MLDPQNALIYTMVLASAADAEMTQDEIQVMSDIVKVLPVFRDYDLSGLSHDARSCAEMLADPDGIETALDIIFRTLPEKLRETAYALACDVVAADGNATQEELRLLEMVRDRLCVGRLEAAAIERGTRARFTGL